MPRIFDGLVEVDWGQFWLTHGTGVFPSGLSEAFRGQVNGLCGAVDPHVLVLITATHSGIVAVTIDTHESCPAVDETWEEIVEVSFQAAGEKLVVVEMLMGTETDVCLAPGNYRVRYCAQGMDQIRNPDLHVGEVGVDRYHFDFWLSDPAPDTIIKQTSGRAAYWHECMNRPNQDVT